MPHSILNHIGNTPLVEIRHLNPNPRVTILAKLEYMNPGGSIKDRAALSIIEAGEQSGELTPDKTVIEATSGNTGIGLALVCAVKGYRLLLAMSEAVSLERRKILKARGAEILLTPAHLGTDGAIEEVYRLVRENPAAYFMADQFNNPANWKAHEKGTAVEIWEQTRGAVTTVVATMGTTGTVMGLVRGLKACQQAIRVIGVEPFIGHKIQGLKNMKEAYRPEIYEKERLDRIVNVEDEEAFETTRLLARKEGLFVGMSSGAAMAIAAKEAVDMTEGTLVVVFPDSGERYLSTPLFVEKEEISLRLFNTLNRTKVPFEPLQEGKVSMYTCGPTAHDRMRLGELRRFMFADLLSRYLTSKGYHIRHIMNITDLDDKTIAGSMEAEMELRAFTDQHIEAFETDLARLNIHPADAYPRTSDHLDQMVALSEKLLKKGMAYEKLRSLYFDISRLSDYGCLSGVDLDKIRLGATVDLDEYEKENPRDFTLFKRAKLTDLRRGLFIPTEWGNVRPSWHLQCAAMSMHHLGDSFDIHTGGREHVFPHHENEMAIATAVTGKPLARFWLHCEQVNGHLTTDADNSADLTLCDFLDLGFSSREIRYWLLSSHYRKPLILSMERLQQARRSLNRLDACLLALQKDRSARSYGDLKQLLYDLKNGFATAMDDDLNIAAALATLFGIVRKINRLMHENWLTNTECKQILDAFRQIDAVLGCLKFDNLPLDKTHAELLQQRDEARARQDWETADRIREQLRALGVEPKDCKAAKLQHPKRA